MTVRFMFSAFADLRGLTVNRMSKEASARININKLLEDAGWRFFDECGKKPNIQLEKNIPSHQKLLG